MEPTKNILSDHVTFKRKRPQQNIPGEFDTIKGAWVTLEGTFLCENGQLDYLGTKKEDVETGEDTKGE